MNNQLNRKRNRAILAILGASAGTGTTSALPTPMLESAKQLGLAAADMALCMKIYEIYYEDSLSFGELHKLLGVAGIVALAAGGTGYVAVKLGQGLFDEIMNVFGPFGGAISGAITGSMTAAIGVVWLLAVHHGYKSRPKLAYA